jgi:SAM-dependent methyltransferase
MSDHAKGATEWNRKHRDQPIPAPEPFVIEMLPRIPRGIALDVACGRGRNSLALARAGIRVVAVDFSAEAIRTLTCAARSENLHVSPVVANCTKRPVTESSKITNGFCSLGTFSILSSAPRRGTWTTLRRARGGRFMVTSDCRRHDRAPI